MSRGTKTTFIDDMAGYPESDDEGSVTGSETSTDRDFIALMNPPPLARHHVYMKIDCDWLSFESDSDVLPEVTG